MDKYAKLQKTIDKLLKLYGKPCVVVEAVQGAYNPDTGMVENSEILYYGRMIEGGYTLAELEGTLVQAGSKVGVVKITDVQFTGALTTCMHIHPLGDAPRPLREVQAIQPGERCLYWRFVAGS